MEAALSQLYISNIEIDKYCSRSQFYGWFSVLHQFWIWVLELDFGSMALEDTRRTKRVVVINITIQEKTIALEIIGKDNHGQVTGSIYKGCEANHEVYTELQSHQEKDSHQI